MNKESYSDHLTINKVIIDDKFWNEITELVRREVIPYQYKALQDEIPNAEKSYCIENFIKAGKIKKLIESGECPPTYPVDKWQYTDNNCDENAFHGWVFQDSDVYKWLEAVGYSLSTYPDNELKKQADEFIDIICDAQLENGYLDTLYIINDRDKVFTNLKDYHELYCFGHLAEAAVAYYKGTGVRKLLDCACRFADLICDTFSDDGVHGYPGHEIAEMALVKLYKQTGNKKYLETAEFFIEERGKKPYYYDLVLGKQTVDDNYHYNQAHRQPKAQREAVGHAVRGVYLYSGMADIAKEKNDEELYEACKSIWDNIENRKLYITGGIGSTVDGEAFSFDYDLPNDLAYSETCASIGLIFFARRMSEIKNDRRYAEVAERALYNCVLSGMAEDGKSFFYVNPLEVLPEASAKDSRKYHIKPVRQKWFSCACCPPNLARLITSLGEYIYNENGNTVFVNQFIGSTAETDKCTIRLNSSYIYDGKIYISLSDLKQDRFTLAVRIPEYVTNFKASRDYEIIDGYMYFGIDSKCSIEIEYEIMPRLVKCSNKVRANSGKVAVCRGPFVYTLEEADNGNNLQLLTIDKNSPLEFNKENNTIIARGYREIADSSLYSEYKEPEKEKCELIYIPYYRWGNRGENEMSVYVRLD